MSEGQINTDSEFLRELVRKSMLDRSLLEAKMGIMEKEIIEIKLDRAYEKGKNMGLAGLVSVATTALAHFIPWGK